MQNKVIISPELFEDPDALIDPPARRDKQAYAAVKERVGSSPEKRLRWLLEFIQKEPTTLSVGEKLDLIGELYVFFSTDDDRGTAEDYLGFNFVYLCGVQQRLKEGITQFVSQGSWEIVLDPDTGRFSHMPIFLLTRETDKICKHYLGDYLSCVSLMAADLIEAEGERIRTCSECKKIFLPVKRQEYCGSQCSQKARTRRFRATHQAELSERRHQAYERQIRKKPGLVSSATVGTRRKRSISKR